MRQKGGRRRLKARMRLFFKAEMGVRFSSLLYQAMSMSAIELEGFEIESASELYCDRGGDHTGIS